jgi:excisionase family DNA binding protein
VKAEAMPAIRERHQSMALLTPKQAHERLEKQVSLTTIYQAVEEQRLPHYRVSGGGKRGKILIDEADLLNWLENCKVQGGSRPPPDTFTHRRP